MFLAVDLTSSLLTTLLAASGGPIEGVAIPDCDFGQNYQVRHVTCDFVVSNDNDASRTIIVGKPAYPSDSISPSSVTVAPHGTATLTASMDLSLDAGNSAHSFMLTARGGTKDVSHEIVARGFVESVLDEPRTIVDFNVVDLNAAKPAEKVFEIQSDESPDVRLVGVAEKPTYLNVSISAGGQAATLRFAPDTPWSFVNDIVRFKTNSPIQPEVAIQVQADVHGNVVADSNPYNLGMIRQGNSNEFSIRVTDRLNKPLRLGELSVEDIHAHVEQAPCVPKADACRLLKLTLGKDQPFGHLHGTIGVDLPDYKKQLRVNVWGLYVRKETEVKDLTEEASKAAAARSNTMLQDDSLKDGLGKAIQAATAPKEDAARATPPAPPPGHGPLIRWSVANENLVHGYLIYRADAENGPYVRLTHSAIPADRVPEGSSYQWRDNSAVTGQTYWYYIVTLLNDGKKQRLSGAARVLAK